MSTKRSLKVLKRKQKQKRMITSHTSRQLVRKGNNDHYISDAMAALAFASLFRR